MRGGPDYSRDMAAPLTLTMAEPLHNWIVRNCQIYSPKSPWCAAAPIGERRNAAATLRSDLDRQILCDCFRNVLCQNGELYLEFHGTQRPRQDSRTVTAIFNSGQIDTVRISQDPCRFEPPYLGVRGVE